jgi:hypothetical protein
MTSLATRLAAVAMGGNAVYGDLKPGDTFSFPTTRGKGVVYRKLANGYFTFADAGPRAGTFRTGKGTAVVKLLPYTGGPA